MLSVKNKIMRKALQNVNSFISLNAIHKWTELGSVVISNKGDGSGVHFDLH